MAEQNPDLLKQADELGIKTDRRWGDERLQQEIDAKLAETPADSDGGSPASEPTTNPEPFGGKGDHDGDGRPGGAAPALHPMIVNRDFWDKGGVRHRKGTVVEVTAEAAIDGAASGALSRVR